MLLMPGTHAASHEEVERLERLIVTDFKNEAKGHKERLYQNHRVRKALDQMQERSAKLVRVTHVACSSVQLPSMRLTACLPLH